MPFGGPDQFDPSYYLEVAPDVAASAYGQNHEEAWKHYSNWGVHEGRSPNPFFNPRYYLATNADVVAAFGANNNAAALQHWVKDGINEGRRGSPAFDVRFYIETYPDLKAAFGNNYRAAYAHWANYGVSEGRRSIPEVDQPLIDASGVPNYTARILVARFRGGPGAKEALDMTLKGLGAIEAGRQVKDLIEKAERFVRERIDRELERPEGRMDYVHDWDHIA